MKLKSLIIFVCIFAFIGASCVRASKSCKKDYKKVHKNKSAWTK